MSDHEYTPQVAFELLMRKLAERDHALAEHVRAVVNQGRDMQERESSNRGRNKKYRVYRKTVTYPYDEALQVALDALAACFIEQPLFVESCLDHMAKAPVRWLTNSGRITSWRTIPSRPCALRKHTKRTNAA